jgi:hypothetical protein
MGEVRVHVPDAAWEDGDYDDDAPAGHRLYATLVVNGTSMYLEAHLLVPGSDPQRVYADDEAVCLVRAGVHADAHWETTTIRGRKYVLISTPFC